MKQSFISKLLALLEKEHGRVSERQDRKSPVAELVLTVLSQNTSGTNSRRAFQSLLARFSSWEEVAEARLEEIEEAIKGGGLGQVKAGRIKAILERIREERGDLSAVGGFLSELPLEKARAWLRHLPGVGPKTAACVLLFSLGKPALPVDTHIHRVASRLGLLEQKVSAEKAHDILERLIPAKDVYRFHILLIEHGRRICKAQRPLCHLCPLLVDCRLHHHG